MQHSSKLPWAPWEWEPLPSTPPHPSARCSSIIPALCSSYFPGRNQSVVFGSSFDSLAFLIFPHFLQLHNSPKLITSSFSPRVALCALRLEVMVGLITSPLILSSLQAGFGNESLQSYTDLGSNSQEFHETSIALNSFFTPKSSRGRIGNL